MTNRNRSTGKIESTIELYRTEGKWRNVIQAAEELKIGSPQNECLVGFLIGEAKLESYLEEHPPVEAHFPRAKTTLAEARNFLSSVTGENGRRAGIALDAHLLLAKLYYTCGQYDDSLEHFTLAELDQLAEKPLSSRSLRILAESYAIKGLCLENRKSQQDEQQQDMISCFERASDLGLLYLQGSETAKMGAVLETTLQRAPIVLMKTGKLQLAIERYRCMLTAVETKATQALRLTLARQLAEVLLRGVSGQLYSPPTISLSPGKSQKRLWVPNKYSVRNQFVPRNLPEETILLILIAESLAVKDAVLSQSPEFQAARVHAMNNATAVYDLLSIAVTRFKAIGLLCESFEKALKFSFNEGHIWRQYALSLVSVGGRHLHAFHALKETAKLDSNDSFSYLMAARVCFEHLGLVREGVDCATEALRRETKRTRASRAQLLVGIGLQQLASAANLKSDRDRYAKMALDALEKAVQLDGNDHLAEFYLACQHALNYNIGEALVHIKAALALRAEHAASLHLFALLLTANRRPREALMVVEDALEEFPDDIPLLHVLAHLQLYLQDVEASLDTLQRMLTVWREVYESQINQEPSGGGFGHTPNEQRSHTDTITKTSQLSDRDSNSVYAVSLAAASRIEQALSEVTSSLSSFSPPAGQQKPWLVQLRIWLLLSEVYLAIDQPQEALNCLQEAATINPLSHQLMFGKGQVHAHSAQWKEAKECFQNAVSANPHHTEALRALGETHLVLGEPRLAEKMLKDAARIDPNQPEVWFALGRVMETLGDNTAAADCMASALQLEPSCPIIPFSAITMVFE